MKKKGTADGRLGEANLETGLGVVVADVTYYPGNSGDNLGGSLRNGCNSNNFPGLVALVTTDAEEQGDLWPVRTGSVATTAPG